MKKDIIERLYADVTENLEPCEKERSIFKQISEVQERLVAKHGEEMRMVLNKLENLYTKYSDLSAEKLFAIGFDYGLALKVNRLKK